MLRYLVSICFFIVLWVNSGYGQKRQSIVLSSEQLEKSIELKDALFFDAGNQLADVKLFLEDSLPFVAREELKTARRTKSGSLWGRIYFKNTTGQRTYLQILRTLSDSVSFLYHPVGAPEKYVYEHFSPRIEVEQRPLSLFFPSFRLPDDAAEYVLYLQIRNTQSVTINVYLATESRIISNVRKMQFGFGLYFGIIFLSMVYSLITYATSREKLYLQYMFACVGVSLAIGLLFGYLYEFVIPASWSSKSLEYALLGLFAVPYLYFTIPFLESAKRAPLLHRIFKVTIWLMVLISLLMPLASDIFRLVVRFLFVIAGLLSFLMAIYIYRTGFRQALLFLLARSMVLITTIVLVSQYFGLFDTDVWDYLLLPIGSGMEVLLLAMAVAFKVEYYRQETEKKHHEFVRMLQEKDRINRQQNLTLERIVNERTRELQMQQEETLRQNELLQQNQEEILAQRDIIELKIKELEIANRRMMVNEQVLTKAYKKLKESEESVRNKNEVLSTINNKLNKSIEVAQLIQKAILPYSEKRKELLKESFIIMRPKDIVSGDFYWLNKVEDTTILALVDCTGHGVPGAFMSLICNTLLDKIIRVWKILYPNEILLRLDEEIRIALTPQPDEYIASMDVIVCAWKPDSEKSIKLQFAGARRPLYVKAASQPGLLMLPPARFSVGGYSRLVKQFNTTELTLASGSTIYLSSDGYIDQNNVQRRRFGSQRFMKLLEQIASEPMHQQKELLIHTIDQYQENTEQRDDILIVAVRL